MDGEMLSGSGGFGSALMLVGDRLASSAPALPNPAAILADMMDFPGSVALAELLAEPPPEGPSAQHAAAHAARLCEDVRARLDSLEAQALKPLLGRRAPHLPNADEIFAVLAEQGVDQARSEERMKRVAAELCAPLSSAFSTCLRQAQAHVSTLRWEVTHEVRALGPRATRLEKVDAAITRAMQAKMGELLDRMEHGANLTFERACAHAIIELPEGYTKADLTPWSAPGGWIERYRDRCVRMTRALYGHMRRNLEGLLRAASHAEGS
jgi:Protein of unknown function (DUF3348)